MNGWIKAKFVPGTVEVVSPIETHFTPSGDPVDVYQAVKDDWDNYGPMCAPGGCVLFHDILPPTQAHPEIEVAHLWEEIRKTHRTLEIVADRGAEWGGIGVVLV